jgi:hypothetical protein
LIATPEKYEKKQVSIIGYAIIKFEAQGIYLSKSDAEQNINSNGLWILLSEEQLDRYQNLNNKYVLVEGTFDPNIRGHGGMYSGSITNITRFEKWH